MCLFLLNYCLFSVIYFRLTPVYAIVLMLYMNLFHYMRNGPLMPPVLDDITSCKDIWWRNLLYIQNLWPADNFSDVNLYISNI